MRKGIGDRLGYGDAVVERFGDKVLAAIKGDLDDFKALHASYAKASGVVDSAQESYDRLAGEIADLDEARDKTVLSIADVMPAAGLGTRTKPFGRFSKLAPSRINSLPYAAQTIEVRSLLNGILGAGPSADIAKLCGQCAKENDAVDEGLRGLTRPLATLNEARAKRDALVPDWERLFRRLKEASRVAFRDDPGHFDALFGEQLAVQTKTRSLKRAPAAPVAEPTPGSPGQPAAPAEKPAKGRRRR